MPGQVRPDEWGLSLVLQQAGERYISGKTRSKRSLQELAPNSGASELQFDLPKNVLATSEGRGRAISPLACGPQCGSCRAACRGPQEARSISWR